MRILVAIPHYFDAEGASPDAVRHGSLARDPRPRIEALTACIAALRQRFDGPQVMIDIATRKGVPANARLAADRLDVVVCTTRGKHLLPHIPLPDGTFLHQPSGAEAPLL